MQGFPQYDLQLTTILEKVDVFHSSDLIFLSLGKSKVKFPFKHYCQTYNVRGSNGGAIKGLVGHQKNLRNINTAGYVRRQRNDFK